MMVNFFALNGCVRCLDIRVNYIPDIRMVHKVNFFNADLDPYPEEIKIWRQETGGEAPAIQVGTDWYVGIEDIKSFTDSLDDIHDRDTFPLKIPAAIGGIA